MDILSELKCEHGFDFTTRAITTENISYPAEFGIFGQTIFINDSTYSDEELRYILLHELIHFQNGSNRIKVFMNIVCCIYWWDPFARLFANHIDDIIEMYVDNAVAGSLDSKGKLRYMYCVFNVYKHINKSNINTTFTESMAGKGGKNKLLERFKAITENKRLNIPACVFSGALLCICILFSLSFLFYAAGQPSVEDYIGVHIALTDENSYIGEKIGEEGFYAIYYEGKPIIEHTNRKSLEIIRKFSRMKPTDPDIPNDYFAENGAVNEKYMETVISDDGGYTFIFKK